MAAALEVMTGVALMTLCLRQHQVWSHKRPWAPLRRQLQPPSRTGAQVVSPGNAVAVLLVAILMLVITMLHNHQ